jgi:hypothetical protein
MSREFIAHSTRMLHFPARLSTSASSHHDVCLVAFITNIAESDFRYTQVLPFTHPKLAVTAQVSENDFAALLDQRIKRLQEAKLIEHQPQVETKPLKPRLSDRRYRRL